MPISVSSTAFIDLLSVPAVMFSPGGNLIAVNHPSRMLLQWDDDYLPSENLDEWFEFRNGPKHELFEIPNYTAVTFKPRLNAAITLPVFETFIDSANGQWGIITRDSIDFETAASSFKTDLDSFLAHASDGVVITNEEGVVIHWNAALSKLTGISAMDAIGISALDILRKLSQSSMISDDDLAAAERRMNQILKEGEYEEEVSATKFTRPDHSETWIEKRSFTIPTERGFRIASIVRPADPLKEVLEERNQLRERLITAEKNESLRLLAGGIAHDFNNMLGGILGFTELAMLSLPDDSPIISYMKKIEEATHRAANLSKQLLAFSGHGKFLVQKVDISTFVDSLRSTLSSIVDTEYEIEYELTAGIHRIEVDIHQLGQLVLNLVRNAIEAQSDSPAKLTIRTTEVKVTPELRSRMNYASENLSEHCALLEVIDNGPGIDAETLARVFEPFFTTKQFGRGMGLPAVYGIVRGHNGAIKIETQSGTGTNVAIYFPIVASELADVAPVAPVSNCVLVIDDDENLLAIHKLLLEKSGYPAFTASNGTTGIELFRKHRDAIGLVILDMTMPGMGGEEVYEHLVTIKDSVSIIVTSGYSEAQVRSKFLRRQPGEFLQKPYAFDTLMERIKRMKHEKSTGTSIRNILTM